MSSKQRIFDNIEQLNYEYKLNLSIPKDIPEGCNCIKYTLVHNSGKYAEEYCLENRQGFFVIYSNGKLEYCSENLERDALVFAGVEGATYVYLRLEQKDVFTPDCLVGVETNKGFITSVIEISFSDIFKPFYYAHTTESLFKEDLHDLNNLKFFISDYSDETVSFKDYVEMFYER